MACVLYVHPAWIRWAIVHARAGRGGALIMSRIAKRPRLHAGDRIRMRQNGTKWGSVEIPLDTQGTVYLHQRRNGSQWRCVHWDGFDLLQPNGFPFGIGGDHSMDY